MLSRLPHDHAVCGQRLPAPEALESSVTPILAAAGPSFQAGTLDVWVHGPSFAAVSWQAAAMNRSDRVEGVNRVLR
jgi:hypothetical protein